MAKRGLPRGAITRGVPLLRLEVRVATTHRVLAVDDNPRDLTIVEKTLGGQYQLVTASSGEEALYLAPRYRPDLVLLDIMMPGLDGFETCKRLRAIPSLSNCKIILVSARATTADRLDGYSAGADDYVTKPFDSEELLAKLRVYLRLKSVEEVDHLKSDLLDILSHETRTPLTAILSPAALLLEDPTLSEEQREFVEMIRSGGQRLLALVDKVAYLSQLKAGLVPRALGLLDMEEVAEQAIADVRARAARADVAIRLVADSTAPIAGDHEQIRCALDSMLDNAVRLSPASGVVRVGIRLSGPWVEVSVSDQGPGIAPEFIGHVFDEFAVHEVHHHGHGHGLSLATARLIVEQHGGSVGVESERDSGSTFQMLLPSEDLGSLTA